MTILDTNVVSEIMRVKPNGSVITWLDRQDFRTIYITSVTWAELNYGLLVLPLSQKRNHINNLLLRVRSLFINKTLPFDDVAAEVYANISALAKQAGNTLSLPDAYIAAIASARSATVATRDTTTFAAASVPVVNPWQAADVAP